MPHKFKVVLSDLHLGAGHAAEGNSLEDFERDAEFASFLDEIAGESNAGGADAELILNGDIFDMPQVPFVGRFEPRAIYPPELYLLASARHSARKMEIIVAGHPAFFDGLGRFIQTGPPRRTVTIVSGNHDLDLYWPAVQLRIRLAAGATGERAPLLDFAPWRIQREGLHVEHGNQYSDFLSRVPDMADPRDAERPGRLEGPIGSRFIADVFNDVERERYWIDGVKPITALLWYAMAYDFAFAARATAALIRAVPDLVLGGILGVQSLRRALLGKLEKPESMQEMAERYASDEDFRAEFNGAVARVMTAQAQAMGDDLPVEISADTVAMGDQVRQGVRSALSRAARQRAEESGAAVVLFGHTHDAEIEALPDGGAYVNSGTWTWRADFTGQGKSTWRDLFDHPERFTDDRRLSYARVDYDGEGRPSASLKEYSGTRRPVSERM